MWPQWLLDEFPESDGPYTTYRGDIPIAKRDGQPRTFNAFPRIQVPMCEPHNGHLNTRFEQPVKPVIRELLTAEGQALLSPAEARDVGLWIVKTWALLAHPMARSSDPGFALSSWLASRSSAWQWMADDSDPPAALSAWVALRGQRGSGRPRRLFDLPLIVADGQEFDFDVKHHGLRFLDISLVWHPGWEIDHPLERDGRAVRIWPRPPDQPADLRELSPIDPDEFAWTRTLGLRFEPGRFPAAGMTPLSERFDMLADGPEIGLQGGGCRGSR